jgi:hypothetical protein
MKYPKYPIVANDPLSYEFYSEGPQGRIKKSVVYSHIEGNLYNLGFGDWNEELKGLDDSSRSNNGDRDKVLATVAYTALDFIGQFPDAQIFAEGSTSARTRLYQMGTPITFWKSMLFLILRVSLMSIGNPFNVAGIMQHS